MRRRQVQSGFSGTPKPTKAAGSSFRRYRWCDGEYGSHPFLIWASGRFASRYFLVKKFSKSPGFEWLYDDFICLQQDRSHGALHVAVAADQQGKRVRLGMARGANPGKNHHLALSNYEQPPESLDGRLNGPREGRTFADCEP